MTRNKIVLGITGGTGCGKSAFSDAVRELGITVIDADKIGHFVTSAGQPALDEIREYFGCGVMNDDGTLNRRALGSIVFADKTKLERLNEITHKHIKELIARLTEDDNGDITAVDGALLFECGISCDKTVSVIAPIETRLKRITERDGISEEDAKNRIASQRDDEFYISNADFVVYNSGTKEELYKKAKDIIETIRGER